MQIAEKINELDLTHTIWGINLKISDILVLMLNIIIISGCFVLYIYHFIKNKYKEKHDTIILGPLIHICKFIKILKY